MFPGTMFKNKENSKIKFIVRKLTATAFNLCIVNWILAIDCNLTSCDNGPQNFKIY